jgi:hypothetical protein
MVESCRSVNYVMPSAMLLSLGHGPVGICTLTKLVFRRISTRVDKSIK